MATPQANQRPNIGYKSPYLISLIGFLSIIGINVFGIFEDGQSTYAVIEIADKNIPQITAALAAAAGFFIAVSQMDFATSGSDPVFTESEISQSFQQPVIKHGDSGENVKNLQVFLTSEGCSKNLKDASGGFDGKFGKDTQACVEEIQNKYGLNVTGIWDHQTLHHFGSFLPKKS